MNSQISIKKRSAISILAAVFVSIIVFMASASAVDAKKPTSAAAAKPGTSTITEIVVSNPGGNFDVLLAAVSSAGLAETLDGKRQFTVFAPTDQAFVNLLPAGSTEADAIAFVESLPSETLSDILLYHVTSGRKTSAPVTSAPAQQMLNGDKLPLGQILDAGINALDISARNGVVHVVNSVLLPQ